MVALSEQCDLAVGIAVGLQTLENVKSVLQSATGDRYRQGIASAHAGRVPAAVFAMLRVCDVGAEYAAEAKCFRFRPVGRQGSFVEPGWWHVHRQFRSALGRLANRDEGLARKSVV